MKDQFIRKRRRYSKEFKNEAVQLVLNSPDTPVSEISDDLGIKQDLLNRWKREFLSKGENSFPGNGKLNKEDAELHRLQKELAKTQRERDILKKALAIFSRIPE